MNFWKPCHTLTLSYSPPSLTYYCGYVTTFWPLRQVRNHAKARAKSRIFRFRSPRMDTSVNTA
jgi:hypothetical protein